jgi:hypothetical protein
MGTKSAPHSFHIVLADKTERDVAGTDVRVVSGALEVHNDKGTGVVIYAPGAWYLCELERKDDR